MGADLAAHHCACASPAVTRLNETVRSCRCACEPVDVSEDLESSLRDAWNALEALYGGLQGEWAAMYQRLGRAAFARPELRELFPFTSHMRLCFSRCSAYPFTIDCPAVAASREGYHVVACWVVSDPMPPVLGSTADPEEAIQVVVDHLPTERDVWLGS